MKKILLMLALPVVALNAFAQSCYFTGTGADGAFHAMADTVLPGGTYNFTTFHIDDNVTVKASGQNPLVIYCSGSALIEGTLTVSGENGTSGVTFSNSGLGATGVAGGGNGGNGIFDPNQGPLDGFSGTNTGGGTYGSFWSGGGGGGYASFGDSTGGAGGFGGPSYGTSELDDLIGGSGGGGGSGGSNCGSGGGGAGGGVILFTSPSLTIAAGGAILSNGGNGGSDGDGNCGGGGAGSGGSLIILCQSIQNNGTISALGGVGGASATDNSPYYGIGGNGSEGRVRIGSGSPVSGSGTVSPQPGSTAFAGATYYQSVSVCAGETFTVGQNIYDESGMYTDVFPLPGGCDSTVFTTLTVNPAPVVSQNGHTLSTQLTGTYQWINCDLNAAINGATAQSFQPSADGNYAVIVTNGNCADTSDCFNYSTAGMGENQLDMVIVFPNPTTGLVKVMFDGNLEISGLELTDLSGRKIKTAIDVQPGGVQFDFSGESKGIYLLTVTSAGRQKTFRITKQ